MSMKKNFFLLFLLIGLMAFYYLYDLRGGERRREIERMESLVFQGVNCESIDSLILERIPELPVEIPSDTVQRLIQRIRLQNNENQWRMLEPVNDRIDVAVVNELCRAVTELQRGEIIDDTRGTQEKYGVISPAFNITVISTDSSHTLQLGNQNPTSDAYYATLNHRPPVFLLDRNFDNWLFKTPINFRDRHPLPVSLDEVTRIEARIEETAFSLQKTDDDWLIVEPLNAEADSQRIDTIFRKLLDHEIVQFADDISGKSMTEDLSSIRKFTFQSLPDNEWTLTIGNEADPGGKTFFAETGPEHRRFRLPKEIVNQFTSDLFDYRSKQITGLTRKNIQRIQILSDKTAIDLQKDSTDIWQIDGQTDFEIDQQAVSGLLASLTYLRATGIATDNVGIDETGHKIILSDDDGSVIETLYDLGEPEDGVGRWVRSSRGTTIFRVSGDDAELFSPDLEHFRSRQLLRFDRHSLKQISVEGKNGKLVFGPDGDAFKVITGNININTQHLEKLYWSLHNLQYRSIISHGNRHDDSDTSNDVDPGYPAWKLAVIQDDRGLTELHVGNPSEVDGTVHITDPHTHQIWSVHQQDIDALFTLQL